MIKAPTALGRWLVGRFHAIGQGRGEGDSASANLAGRSESLLQLHETQNRVIHSIYKISISGFVAIFMILLSFTLFLIADSDTPLWLTGVLVGAELLLIAGFVRTYQDFRQYQTHYQEVSLRLRDLLRRYLASNSGKSAEHRLIAALKPKEYEGWDAKSCHHCDTPIELSANVCQHCGKEQDSLFMN